jgi:hypothetical protein
MTATYQVKPYQVDDFFRLFRRNYAGETVTVTVDAPIAETQAETNARILTSAMAAKSGEPAYKSMTLDEFKDMVEAL